MATKNCIFSKNNYGKHTIRGLDDQYNNLNLNENYKQPCFSTVGSKGETTNHRSASAANYDPQDTHHLNKRSSDKFLNEFKKKSDFAYNKEKYDYGRSKTNQNPSNNQSTLSHHIASYENSIETTNSSSTDKEKQGFKSIKKLKKSKKTFKSTDEPKLLKEYPRQQDNESRKEEIINFKASVKLLNCNKTSTPVKQQHDSDDGSENQDNVSSNDTTTKPSTSNSNYLSTPNNEGDEVDFIFIYKTLGLRFFSVEPNDLLAEDPVMVSHNDITSNDTALYHIWKLFLKYRGDPNVLILIWNDDHKGYGKNKNVGHAKGIIIMKGDRGLFISHSIPRFIFDDEYIYPENAELKAQHFFSLNISKETFKKLTFHLWTSHPDIFFKQVPDSFLNIGKMNEIFNGKFKKPEDGISILKDDLQTVNGFKFYVYTRIHLKKKKKTNKDPSIWDILPEKYNQDFVVQTFSSENQKCTQCAGKEFKIFDVIAPLITHTNEPNSAYMDHSKIGFSDDSEIICFCDLNHTVTQMARGGSLFVFMNGNLVNAFQKLIEPQLYS